MKKPRLTPRICLALCFAAVAAIPSPGQPVSGRDSRGAVVRLANPASRIVCLVPGALESLYAIGAGSTLVGRGRDCGYPPEALALPIVHDSLAALAVKPGGPAPADLVILDHLDLQAGIDYLAPDEGRLFIWNPKDFGELARLIMYLGQLVGRDKAGLRTAARLTKSVRDVSLITDRLHSAERPFVLWINTRDSPPGAEGDGLAQALIWNAGGRPLPPGDAGPHEQSAIERFSGRSYVMVIAGASGSLGAPDGPYPRNFPPSGMLVLDSPGASQAGPCSASALLALARFLHPELFP